MGASLASGAAAASVAAAGVPGTSQAVPRLSWRRDGQEESARPGLRVWMAITSVPLLTVGLVRYRTPLSSNTMLPVMPRGVWPRGARKFEAADRPELPSAPGGSSGPVVKAGNCSDHPLGCGASRILDVAPSNRDGGVWSDVDLAAILPILLDASPTTGTKILARQEALRRRPLRAPAGGPAGDVHALD
jgi:hypothetical protein